MPTHSTAGTHLLLDIYWHESPDLLNFMKAVKTACNLSIVKTLYHRFEPQGETYLALLQESHFAIHTYPEHNYWSVDLYTCGETDYIELILALLKKYRTASYSHRSIVRGLRNKKYR